MRFGDRRFALANPVFYWEVLFNLVGVNLNFFTSKLLVFLLLPFAVFFAFDAIEALRISLVVAAFTVIPRVNLYLTRRSLRVLMGILVCLYLIRVGVGSPFPFEVRGSSLRATGFSTEPSYFAEFGLALFVAALAVRDRSLAYLAIGFSVLTLGFTPLQQFLLAFVCWVGSVAARFLRLGPFLTVLLIAFIPVGVAKFELFRDFVYLTLHVAGSWRSVSNYEAMRLAEWVPALEGYRGLISSAFEREDASWIVSVYSFEPFLLLYFGWVVGSCILIGTLYFHLRHLRGWRLSKVGHWLVVFVYTYYFFFAPKWSLAMIAALWMYLHRVELPEAGPPLEQSVRLRADSPKAPHLEGPPT